MMCHRHIPLTSSLPPWRQRWIWRLCCTYRGARSKCCTRTMFFCRCSGRHQKVHRGGENSPPMQTSFCPLDMVLCRHDTAPSADHARRWNHWIEKSKHKQINGMVSAPGGVGWWRCKFFDWGSAKTDAASDSRGMMGDWLVRGLLDPNVNQDIVGKLFSRGFDRCNINMVVPVWKDTNIDFKGTK